MREGLRWHSRSGRNGGRAYLVHADVQGIMRLGVNLELDLGRGQLQRAGLRAPPPQNACDRVHAPQVHAQLVVQPLVVDARLRFRICQRRSAPARTMSKTLSERLSLQM